ncbi:MAG: hypothetical protein KAX20_00915 [Candidatus Omnitrophica bacterium]|nr:hypothetical protein [Candidatus Omnitrophota bacterium]
MKIYIVMCGNKEEAREFQRVNWITLGEMGIASGIDFNSSSITIANEIELLHLTPTDLDRLYGMKIEGFRTCGTFYTVENSRKIVDRLELCRRR